MAGFNFNNDFDIFGDEEESFSFSSSAAVDKVERTLSGNGSSENGKVAVLERGAKDGKVGNKEGVAKEASTKEVAEKEKEEAIEKEVGDEGEDSFSFFRRSEDAEGEGSESPYTILAKNFFEYLGWEWEDGILEEDSPDGFFGMIENIIKENSIPQYSSQVVADFDKFVSMGGRPSQFLDMEKKYDLPDLDLDNPQDQAYAVYYYLKMTTPLTDEKIKRYIERIHETGELSSEVQESLTQLQALRDQERARLLQEQEKEAERKQKEYKEYVNSVVSYVQNGGYEELGVEMTKGEKENFLRFLFDVDKKTGLTPYQARMQRDPNSAIRLAALVFKGALDGKLESLAKNKVVGDLENKLKKNATQMFSKSASKGSVRDTGGVNLDIFV